VKRQTAATSRPSSQLGSTRQPECQSRHICSKESQHREPGGKKNQQVNKLTTNIAF